jgi:predicted DNA-binding transcriptional regulator AlpA
LTEYLAWRIYTDTLGRRQEPGFLFGGQAPMNYAFERQLLRAVEVAHMLGMSRNTFAAFMKDPENRFPQPYKLTRQGPAVWKLEEVRAFITLLGR